MNESEQLNEHENEGHDLTNEQTIPSQALAHNSFGDVMASNNVLGDDCPTDQPTIAIPVENLSQIQLGEEHFVTYVQNGQTYAIPLSSYEAMQAENLLIDGQQLESLPIDHHHQLTEKENLSTTPVNKNKRKAPDTSKTKNDDYKFGFMSGGLPIPKKPRYQIIPNLDVIQKKAKMEPRYKPIRVDNWGIFLLNRIQAYFERKEICDLVIRFPEKDISINTHKLILCSCSGMFANEEKKGNLSDGLFNMPSTILPESMSEIIKFMYSGKLEVTEETIEPLLTAAKLLDMTVLARLIESQKTNPIPTPERKSKRAKTEDSPIDPIQEAKKFKKIDMKIKEEGIVIKRAEKLRILQKLKKEREEAEKQKLPGKLLPIWINRNDTVYSHISEAKSTALMSSSIKFENNQSVCEQTEERQSERIANKAAKSNTENKEIKVMNTYQKRKDGEKPKIPRKLREMNEHLMFEKILKTGSKNSLFIQCDEQSDNVVLEKDIKDLSKEHLERAKMIEQEDDVNSEYLDNSEFLVGDELDSISATNVADDNEINLPGTRVNTDDISINADQQKDDNIIDKSIRNLEIPKVDKCANEIKESSDTAIPNDSSIDLDDALKDFVKEAEEDSSQSNFNKPRRGRPPKSLQQFPITDSNTSSSEIEDDVFKNQEKMIQELLKKNPQLLKSKKPIQIKIMVVNKGKKVAQTLTIKPVLDEQEKPASPSHQDQKPMIPGFRPIQKVCYSGRQGRPRLLRPGEVDPHAQERRQIKENLKKVCPSIAKLVDKEETEQNENNEIRTPEVKDTVQSRQNISKSVNQISHDNTYTQYADQTLVSQHTAQQIDKIQTQEQDSETLYLSKGLQQHSSNQIRTSGVQEMYEKPTIATSNTALSSYIDIHQVPNTSPSKVSMINYLPASGGELLQLQPGTSNVLSNTAHQIPPGAELVQMVDQAGKYFYVMDMKNLGNIDASSNAIVLPYLPVVTGNTIQPPINTQESQQHISLDNNSLIPITMTGVNTATINRTGEESREQYHVQHIVTGQNIISTNSLSTNNVTLQRSTATSNIPASSTVLGGWSNLNQQNESPGTVHEPGKPVVQVTESSYQQQAQESPGVLTGRTIQINVPLLPASGTPDIDNQAHANVNVDDRKPVVQKLQQDWDSD